MSFRRLLPFGVLATLIALVWRRLEPSERTYLTNIIRQIPELPGRYMV